MRASCPYWEDQTVFQTHRLVLIPQGMSLNRLGKTFNPGFRYFSEAVRSQHGDDAPTESYWVLIKNGTSFHNLLTLLSSFTQFFEKKHR